MEEGKIEGYLKLEKADRKGKKIKTGKSKVLIGQEGSNCKRKMLIDISMWSNSIGESIHNLPLAL